MRHFVLLILSSVFLCVCSARETITVSTPLRDGDFLLSKSTIFKFGFIRLNKNSSDRYVGVWYNNIPIQTIVWVFNRDSPIKDSSGVVSISDDGNLVISDGLNRILWSTNVSVPDSAKNKTLVQILDTGNLILQDSSNNDENLWESFKHPHDSFLPLMTLGTNARTGENLRLTSWKSPSDPSTGIYQSGLNPLVFPELVIWKNNRTFYRSGPWSGQVFIGLPDMDSLLFLDGFNLNNDNQGTATMSYSNNSFMYHFNLDSEGTIYQKDWDKGKQEWRIGLKLPSTDCDYYNTCGPFGVCNPRKKPICSCLDGFVPNDQEAWRRGNWTDGCRRNRPLQCQRALNGSSGGKPDGFQRLQKMKVPYFLQRSLANEQFCPSICLNSCSCTAYAYDRGIGCMFWNSSLIDTQSFLGSGIDLHIRLAGSEFGNETKKRVTIAAAVSGTIVFLICCLLVWCLVAKRKAMKKKRDTKMLLETMGDDTVSTNLSKAKLKDLPLFAFEVLAAATDNFDFRNKLGQGGFGPVYKGNLKDGQEIAVKRLSKASGQGLEELVNEVVVISKLQHRNLVRLLGCCIEGRERLLVYEFMPKKSLDSYLFDPLKQELLDWRTRFNIMDGICRGLLYLHRDSRLKIIHRDLKASNILLDEHLNPKISDFGMARIFRNNEDEANTRRVVGTYGYMSPEYAMGGLFSEKSDVFSLGVLLLEIISGKRNSSHHNQEHSLSLLSYAWKLWNEDKAAALADPVFYNESCEKEVRRCVQIGLLCVQEYADDRPSVSTVIWMLSTENAELPAPKQPASIQRKVTSEAESSTSSSKASANNVSLTTMAGR